MATLDKYLDFKQSVDGLKPANTSNGAVGQSGDRPIESAYANVDDSLRVLVLDTEKHEAVLKTVVPKVGCLWIVFKPKELAACEFEKEGFCTNPKYCNQKGKVYR